jgi:hypothetical protein
MHGYLVVKPCFHPPDGPFVFHSGCKLRFTALVTPRMKIQVAKLLKHDTFIIINLLRLLMQVLAFHEAVACWHTTKAENRP